MGGLSKPCRPKRVSSKTQYSSNISLSVLETFSLVQGDCAGLLGVCYTSKRCMKMNNNIMLKRHLQIKEYLDPRWFWRVPRDDIIVFESQGHDIIGGKPVSQWFAKGVVRGRITLPRYTFHFASPLLSFLSSLCLRQKPHFCTKMAPKKGGGRGSSSNSNKKGRPAAVDRAALLGAVLQALTRVDEAGVLIVDYEEMGRHRPGVAIRAL